MKHIDSEDPRLTAYALGELPEHEAAALRRLAEDDPDPGTTVYGWTCNQYDFFYYNDKNYW